MVELIQEDLILTLGLNFVGFFPHRSAKHNATTKTNHFERSFGLNPKSCALIFYDLQTRDIGLATIRNPKLNHFFMALFWLFKYPTEATCAGMSGLHEDTVRKWVWAYAIAMQALKQFKIVFPDDIQQNNNGNGGATQWVLSVDGTHCRVQEPCSEPDKEWYSHKHHKPCVAYEIGVHLFESRIIWMSGPHKGSVHDMTIFREEGGLKSKLPDGCKAIGDKGYRADEKVSINNRFDTEETRTLKKVARARHEALNGRIKEFDILSERFRHKIDKHKIVFEAVCVVVQYNLENGRPLNPI